MGGCEKTALCGFGTCGHAICARTAEPVGLLFVGWGCTLLGTHEANVRVRASIPRLFVGWLFAVGRLVAVVLLFAGSAPAWAQTTASGGGQNADAAQPRWSVHASAAAYFIPDDDDYVQPTVTADRGALHLESRYQYEDRRSLSAFAGWNLEFGDTVKFEVTPMLGGVFGRTDGVIPALELGVTWQRLEFSTEGEYVIDLGDTSNRFLYNWSELSVWAAEWLRAGIVTQRTRVYDTPRDIQRGLLVGVAASRVDGAFYVFNPGADDQFVVVSVGVSF